MDYEIRRSKRKTMAITVDRAGAVILRAPLWASDRAILAFAEKNRAWIEKQQRRLSEQHAQASRAGLLTEEELADLTSRAKAYIPERVAHFAPLIGVTPGRITVRRQKSRWGSCSAKGNLNFNCLLMLAPPQVIDSVIVHELCHMKEMNHSPRFYAHVRRVFPEYDRWHRWLKENGPVLMARAASPV